MNKTYVMKQLKALGTAQTRKIYGRHGVQGDMFGVSYADLGKLRKQIKVDQALAEQLWATGNHDARVLATMIADPQTIKASTLDVWAKDLDNYVVTDAFSSVVAKSPHARKRMEKWTRARGEWIGAAGWSILNGLATHDANLTDDALGSYLETIEAKIHGSKNRVRYAMNGALISIGARNAKLRRQAVAAAKRIGKVEVDHGETGCKTPDAASYIEKTAAYRTTKKKKSAKA